MRQAAATVEASEMGYDQWQDLNEESSNQQQQLTILSTLIQDDDEVTPGDSSPFDASQVWKSQDFVGR